jgi:hypothetical protein
MVGGGATPCAMSLLNVFNPPDPPPLSPDIPAFTHTFQRYTFVQLHLQSPLACEPFVCMSDRGLLKAPSLLRCYFALYECTASCVAAYLIQGR